MKKVILILTLLLTFIFHSAYAETYLALGFVNEVTEEAFSIVDCHGEEWIWEGDTDKVEEGKTIFLLYDDMNTTDPYDDEILIWVPLR